MSHWFTASTKEVKLTRSYKHSLFPWIEALVMKPVVFLLLLLLQVSGPVASRCFCQVRDCHSLWGKRCNHELCYY